MNQRQHPETTSLELTAVDQDTRPEHDRPVFVYLQLTGSNQLPIELGTGRSAVVLLATLFPDPQAAGNEYYAVKFLRDDPDPQYSEASALRFFTEAEQMWRWGKTGGNIVTYQGWGAIAKDLERKNTRGETREFWWHDYFKGYDPDQEQDNPDQKRPRRAVLNNNSPEFKRIKTRLNLQGPFYILELCQGTLEDLLEDDTPWAALPPYRWIDGYWDALESALKVTSGQVEEFSKHYLDPEHPQRSGYDILNSFKTKPVQVEINDKRTVEHNPN